MDRNSSVIYLNTFTKSLAPSMRAGYMVLPERLLPRYREKLGFYSCTVPSLDQYVLAEYISRGYFEKRLNHIRRKLRQKKSLPH
jgi:GntR family transcriptional regulator/MocR family aminotransferase